LASIAALILLPSIATMPVICALTPLGPVDGFDQDQCASEGDESAIADRGLLTSHGDALETFQLADGLFYSGARLVEQLRKEMRPVLGIRAMWDDGDNASLAARRAIGG
jgi:hypothetical protein